MSQADTPTNTEPSNSMLRALRSRDYRLFFAGQGISVIGTWLTKVATAWVVYKLLPAGSTEAQAALALGIVTFAGLAPTLVLGPVAGVFVDRHDRMRVMVLTQVLALVQSVVLAIMALSGTITIAWVVALQVFQGVINAFDAPARQALTVDLVESRDDLPNAIALNSAMFNGARLIGPVVAAAILAKTNAGWCFVIDAVSYGAVIASLLMLRRRPKQVDRGRKRPLQEMRDGFAYAFGSAPVRTLLLLAAAVSLLSMSMQTLLPIFSTRLQSNWNEAHAYGSLMTAMGVGALGGTIYLAKRRTVVGLGRVISVSSGLLGAAMVGFSFTTHLLPALPLAAMAGAAMIVTMAGSNTILQTIVDDAMRGRLMSFFTMAVMGMAPFGSLLSAGLSRLMDAPGAVRIAGALALVASALFTLQLPALRPIVRKIYVAKGILPEVATGLESATNAGSLRG